MILSRSQSSRDPNAPSCENSRSISFKLIVETLAGARQTLGDLKAIPFVLQASRITDAANALFLELPLFCFPVKIGFGRMRLQRGKDDAVLWD